MDRYLPHRVPCWEKTLPMISTGCRCRFDSQGQFSAGLNRPQLFRARPIFRWLGVIGVRGCYSLVSFLLVLAALHPNFLPLFSPLLRPALLPSFLPLLGLPHLICRRPLRAILWRSTASWESGFHTWGSDSTLLRCHAQSAPQHRWMRAWYLACAAYRGACTLRQELQYQVWLPEVALPQAGPPLFISFTNFHLLLT